MDIFHFHLATQAHTWTTPYLDATCRINTRRRNIGNFKLRSPPLHLPCYTSDFIILVLRFHCQRDPFRGLGLDPSRFASCNSVCRRRGSILGTTLSGTTKSRRTPSRSERIGDQHCDCQWDSVVARLWS